MKNTNIYRRIAAFFLAALVFQVMVLKEVHHLLEHHDQAAHCITKPGDNHLHSEEYAPVDCSICFFQFAPATSDAGGFSIHSPVFTVQKGRFFYQKTLEQRSKWHFQLRGPPARLA